MLLCLDFERVFKYADHFWKKKWLLIESNTATNHRKFRYIPVIFYQLLKKCAKNAYSALCHTRWFMIIFRCGHFLFILCVFSFLFVSNEFLQWLLDFWTLLLCAPLSRRNVNCIEYIYELLDACATPYKIQVYGTTQNDTMHSCRS